LRLFDQGGQRGGVVAIREDSFCNQDSMGFRCSFPDSWLVGESIQVRLSARHLAAGETPSDYDPETQSIEPWYSGVGCTDFVVAMRRAGEEDFVVQATLRSMGVDDLTTRSLYISGIYTLEIGIAPTCLETERASFWARHETRTGGAWERIRGGVMY